MAWTDPTQPNLADYTTFLQNVGISAAVLPPDDPFIQYAFAQAVSLVNPYARCSGIPGGVLQYILAVYNLATALQIQITPDQTAEMTGSIALLVFTVSAVTSGTVTQGALFTSPNVLACTTVTQFLAGSTGGVGTYAIDVSQTVASGDITLTGTYFAKARAKFGLNSFVGGVISESHDESTGQSLAVPDWVKNLTIGDLELLKTPWGRAYLAYAQDYGTIWGLS